MIEVKPRYLPEEFADEFMNWDACIGIDPAFWQKVPEKPEEDEEEKPF